MLSNFLISNAIVIASVRTTIFKEIVQANQEVKQINRINEKPTYIHPSKDELLDAFHLRTVDRLWSITEDLNILYKENWTRLAAQEVQLFQDTLLRSVRQSKVYQPGTQMNPPTHKWTYASAFLYSLTLITTIAFTTECIESNCLHSDCIDN
uniref:Uncharacterized protein n=1 Tax=Glossina austeni TaxID=7395 RepID=A0A1A9VCN1_GLOAU